MAIFDRLLYVTLPQRREKIRVFSETKYEKTVKLNFKIKFK